jgi:hypothetical protein
MDAVVWALWLITVAPSVGATASAVTTVKTFGSEGDCLSAIVSIKDESQRLPISSDNSAYICVPQTLEKH